MTVRTIVELGLAVFVLVGLVRWTDDAQTTSGRLGILLLALLLAICIWARASGVMHP